MSTQEFFLTYGYIDQVKRAVCCMILSSNVHFILLIKDFDASSIYILPFCSGPCNGSESRLKKTSGKKNLHNSFEC